MTDRSEWSSSMLVLRRKEVLHRFGISNTTLWAWVRDGKFPAPIDLGPNTRAWLVDEVDAWLLERAAARRSVSEHTQERKK